MDTIFDEIKRALQVGCFYVALVTSLSLPDVCAALDSNTGETTGRTAELYKAWCLKWVKTSPNLTTRDLYALRCGVMHQGRVGHPKMQYDRILFTLPNMQGNFIGDVKMENIGGEQNRILALELKSFCYDMIGAAREWYSAEGNSANVQRHLPNLVQYRPQGLPPFLVGTPVIS